MLLCGMLVCGSAARAQDSAVVNYRQMQQTLQEQARERARQRRPVIRRSRRSTVEEAPRQEEQEEEETQPVEKLENARVVMVIGDFMADGLAEGLEDLYAQSPGVVVDDESNGSSGLVRDDFYDWPAAIGPLIEARHPAVVVVMIGSNDRQQLRIGGAAEPPRSDAWTSEYENRVAAVVKAVRGRGIPLVWVGLPAFKYASMTSDILAFNDIYQRKVEAANGEFVDIWDGFVDENGAFAMTGPDVNGQPVRLRSKDGIGLSSAGKEKVAFYAEKPLNKILGDAVSPDAGDLGPETPMGLAPGGPARSPDRTAPIPLSEPDLDGATELLGATVGGKPEAIRSPGQRLTVEGIAPPARPGRADDFGGAAPAAASARRDAENPLAAAGSSAIPPAGPATNSIGH